MNNLEKVIKGLVSCNSASCQKCPYNEKKECNDRGFFYSQAIEDAIQLLKEQEPKAVLHINDGYYCPRCSTIATRTMGVQEIRLGTKYCPYCGQAVKWE